MSESDFFTDSFLVSSGIAPSGYQSQFGRSSPLAALDAGMQNFVDKDIPILSQIGQLFGYKKIDNGSSESFIDSDAAGQWYEDSVLGNNSMLEYLQGLMASHGQETVENRLYNQVEAQKARDFSAAEAEKTRNWQRMMRQTAYQDTISDMQKAGLNPILAYQQGVSSTPSGSTAQGYSASSNNAGGDTLSGMINAIANLISSAGSLTNILKKLHYIL